MLNKSENESGRAHAALRSSLRGRHKTGVLDVSMAAKMREQLRSGKLILAPGAHDTMSAKIISTYGFDAVYLSGYARAASYLGKPDFGLMTRTEMVLFASNVVEVSHIPIIADAGDGFGSAQSAARTVKEYERAGVAAIQLGDSIQCAFNNNGKYRKIVPLETMEDRIRAAVDARYDEDFLVIARTNARKIHGIGSAIERGGAFAEAGADIVFIESLETVGEMKFINESIDSYTLINIGGGEGKAPLLSSSELKALGYNIIVYPTASITAMVQSMQSLFSELKSDDKEWLERYGLAPWNEMTM